MSGTNPSTRTIYDLLANRGNYHVSQIGTRFVTIDPGSPGVEYVWLGASLGWQPVGSTGGLATKYWVNAPGNVPACGFTTISSAIAAAVADGATGAHPAVVMIYPGSYAENITVPDGISLCGVVGPAPGAVLITGNISLTGTSGANCFFNILVSGKVVANAAPTQAIQLVFSQCAVNSTGAGDTALDLSTDGVSVTAVDSAFDAGTSGIGFNSEGATSTGQFTDCEIHAKGNNAGTPFQAVHAKGNWTFIECDFRSGNSGGTGAECIFASSNATITLRDCIFAQASGATSPQWFKDSSAGSVWTVVGSATFNGTATKLFDFSGGISLHTVGPVNLGSFTISNWALCTAILVSGGVPPTGWAPDGRKIGQGAGNGTGIFLYYNAATSQWFNYQDTIGLA